MLPKLIYESLPFFQLAVGATLICCRQSWLLTVSGLLFFCAGALVWTIRSDHRRADQTVRHRSYKTYERRIYELKPFAYIGSGLLLVTRSGAATVKMAAMAMALFGVYVLIKRSLHRHWLSNSP